jgi:hypothetical protein
MLPRMQETIKGSRAVKRARRPTAAWIEEVREWRASGQTAVQYAKEHGLHPGTLAAWGSKVRNVVAKMGSAGAGNREPKFLAVRLAGADLERTTAGGGEVEIVLINGRRIRVSGDFQSETLTRLIAIAEGGAGC